MEGTEVPIVYPLHVNKFVRRSSIGTPVRTQSPLYHSGLGEETVMHAPRPHRSIPAIRTPAEDTNLFIPTRGAYTSPAPHLHGTRRRCVRHGRADHIRQDTVSKRKAFGGTKDMLAKSRSGSYIPTGQMERRQMEATSPWIAPMDPFQQSSMTRGVLMADVDVCPDCSQESEIRRREIYGAPDAGVGNGTGRPVVYRDVVGASSAERSAVYRDPGGSTQTVKRPVIEAAHHLYAPASHMHSTELSDAMDPDPLATPWGPPGKQRNVAYEGDQATKGLEYDHAQHATPYQPERPTPLQDQHQQYGSSSRFDDRIPDPALYRTPVSTVRATGRQARQSRRTTDTTNTSDDLVVTKKLTDGLNAVIVEHEGHLRRVVLNKRSDLSEIDRLRRLSRELTSVSSAIAFASAAKDKQLKRSPPQYSVVLDKLPTPATARTTTPRPSRKDSSIPELLSMIDQAAGELHLNSTKAADQYVSHRRESLAATVEHERSLANSSEAQGTLFDMPSPGEQMAHRLGMEQAISAAKEQMAGMKVATRGRAFSSLQAEEPEPPTKQSVETTGSPVNVRSHATRASRAASVSRFSLHAKPAVAVNQTALDEVKIKAPSVPAASSPTLSMRSRKSLPTVVTTKPAADPASSPSTDEPIFETPPPISVTQPSKLRPEPSVTLETPVATPVSTKPVDDHPTTAAAAPPTPRALDTTPQTHSYFPIPTIPTPHFPNLLSFNPFHLRTPEPSSADDSGEPIDPLIAASKAIAPPSITTDPTPYSHAPAQPRDLYFARHADPAVRERARVVREAMRMEKQRTAVQEAAAMERERRRLRRESAVVTDATKGANGGRKGWFG